MRPPLFLSLIANGVDISMFLGVSNTSPFALITQTSIKSAADLRGKRLGAARFGGSSHVSALIALDHLGLEAKRDNVIIMQTGLDPERMAALEQKALDAAMLQRLATKTMIGKGYHQLLNMNQAKIPYQNTVLAARRDQMAANPKLFENFTRAMVEGYAYVFNKENKQAVKEVLAKNLRLSNVEAAEDFYVEALEELDRKPYPPSRAPEPSSNTSPSKIPRSRRSKPSASSTRLGSRNSTTRVSSRRCTKANNLDFFLRNIQGHPAKGQDAPFVAGIGLNGFACPFAPVTHPHHTFPRRGNRRPVRKRVPVNSALYQS